MATREQPMADLTPDMLRRIVMTAGCRDCDELPKVAQAGEVVVDESGQYQLMHNGLRVVADGYCGPWLTEVIRRLRGHHEPQEERVFHELLGSCRPGTMMIELGSGWAFYSLWYAQRVPGARLICVEPDPRNLALGERNFQLNGTAGRFIRASVGRTSHAGKLFPCESGQELKTPEICIDELLASEKIDHVELLFADIQGAELAMLEGAQASIQSGRIRFVVVATHHHSISHDSLTHQRCRDWIKRHGGHVLAAFNVVEGFAGDGLIAASFRAEDAGLPEIQVSRNHPTNSLFRELEYDLAAARRKLNKSRRWFRWLPGCGRRMDT